MDQEVVKTGKTILNEVKIPLADGRVMDGTLRKFPIHGDDGKVIAVGGIHFDVSEISQAKEALKRSEIRLNEAIESLHQAFALYDADDRLIAFNDEYEQIRPGAREIMEKGGTFEDLIRDNIKKGIIPEAYGRGEEFIKERVKRHHNPKGTIIRRFNDGTWSRIEEVRTPSGGVALSFIDITDLKQAEEALGKSEALFRAVVNHSPTKIHIKDIEGRYTLINKVAENLFGIYDEEGRGKTSFDLFPKEVADGFMAHDKAVIESGQVMEEEEQFTLDGEVRTYLTVKFPIYGLDGVTGVGAVGTDITNVKRQRRPCARPWKKPNTPTEPRPNSWPI
jgi:PAS domain S-box-containing protein